jgi:hypothetical protein
MDQGNILQIIQVLLMSVIGGIVRYLVDLLRKAQNVNKLSLALLVTHAIIGMFSGYISFLVVSLFTTVEAAGIIAAGLGSFGSYSTLFWLLEKAKEKLVLLSDDEYSRFKAYMSKQNQDKINEFRNGSDS